MPDPILLAADTNKNIYDIPGAIACGQAGREVSTLKPQDLIPLPKGSNLYLLPDRRPVAFNASKKTFEPVEDCFAVAAFLPPGYTQLFTTAYRENPGAQLLPLFAYTPVALYKNKFHVPAIQVDKRKNHDITSTDWNAVDRKIASLRTKRNRLIPHLINCAKCHGCPNAINFFLGKLECPLPVSPNCNARCLGCISFQKKGSCPSTQSRLKFRPTPQEIAEIALMHIKTASKPIVSFGQGCEGEPLLEASTIEKAIRLIRRQTKLGTIHMNTNASLTQKLEALFDAGLDSVRVSLNSTQEKFYNNYYAPRKYTFNDVKNSILTAKAHKKFVALNYLTMPGLTDREDEFNGLRALLDKTRPDMIQWRNLNYDPQRYFKKISPRSRSKLLGIRNIILDVKKEYPKLRHGYFNVPKEDQ
jgi:wyosine [tRNA(Phe)-imidazoG37] synthetase (radical SAM superfamily)